MLAFSEEIVAGPVPQYAHNAYLAVASQRGIDWVQLWRGYTEATYLGGERHVSGRGFSEGAEYPTAATVSIDSLPQAEVFMNLADMAMRFHHFDQLCGGPGVKTLLVDDLQDANSVAPHVSPFFRPHA